MAKYKEISRLTRQNMMDAFWELYCEKRIEKITVGEVTKKAGYNRSTFYKYFTDIYDVLNQIEESLLPELEEIPPLLPTTDEKNLAVEAFLKLYSNSSKYYTVLLGDNGDPAFAGKIKNGIKKKLMSRIAEGDINYAEMDYAFEYTLSAIMGILSYWFKNGENMSKENLVGLIYGLMSGEILNKQMKTK